MNNIFIVGAGGFGREVFSWTNDWCALNPDWKISGFIDDNLSALDRFDGLPPIVSTIKDYSPDVNSFLVCALGSPQVKKRVINILFERGAQFLTVKHPSAIIGHRVNIGIGTIICPRAVLTCDISVGDFVTINAAATVGHDAVLGNYSTLSGHCDVTGGCILEECVFMGSHAAVLPNTHVGSGSIIGAGSVVMRKVASETTVFGVPAKRIAG